MAFLYRWTEISTSKWYEGSRTAPGCHPDDGYICSSELVYNLIVNNRNNWVRTILVIGDPKYIRELENIRLNDLDAAADPMSYNKDNGNGAVGFSSFGKKWMKLNNNEVLVSEKLWQHYLDNGWTFGRSNTMVYKLKENMNKGRDTTNCKWMTNGEHNRLVNESEQKELLNNDWSYGVSENTRIKIKKSCKSYYNSRTTEQEEKHKLALSIATTNYHSKLSDIEKKERSDKLSKITKELYNNMSQEQKNAVIWGLNKSDKKCENCGIITNAGNYNRWHGIKCRKNIK